MFSIHNIDDMTTNVGSQIIIFFLGGLFNNFVRANVSHFISSCAEETSATVPCLFASLDLWHDFGKF